MAFSQSPNDQAYQAYQAGYLAGNLEGYAQGIDSGFTGSWGGISAGDQLPLNGLNTLSQTPQDGFGPQAPQGGFYAQGPSSFSGVLGPAHYQPGQPPAQGCYQASAGESPFPQPAPRPRRVPIPRPRALLPQEVSFQQQQDQQQDQLPQPQFQPQPQPQPVPQFQLSEPPQQPQQQQQPQQAQLSFEQKRAQFRQVPDPQPNPYRKPGSGRPKKPQRFWAPENATEELVFQYDRLQICDNKVRLAEERLAREMDPGKIPHCEKMVLRNMEQRQKQWQKCEGLEQGQPESVLPLQTAEDNWKKAHTDANSQLESYFATSRELMAAHPELLQADGQLDQTLLRKTAKKSWEGIQTKVNWWRHKHNKLREAFAPLWQSQEAAYGHIRTKADLHKRARRVHEIGGAQWWVKFVWTGDSDFHESLREEFQNPDQSTWGTSGPWHDDYLGLGSWYLENQIVSGEVQGWDDLYEIDEAAANREIEAYNSAYSFGYVRDGMGAEPNIAAD